MIRSLVIAPNSDSSTDAAAEIASADPGLLRRNLTQANLEKSLAEGCNMWIDIVTPEAKEIRWLEGLLQLSPNVVDNLLREDRYPTCWYILGTFSCHSSSPMYQAMETGL